EGVVARLGHLILDVGRVEGARRRAIALQRVVGLVGLAVTGIIALLDRVGRLHRVADAPHGHRAGVDAAARAGADRDRLDLLVAAREGADVAARLHVRILDAGLAVAR